MLVVSISFGGRGRRGETLHFNKSFLLYPNPRRFPNTEFSVSYFKIQTWAKKSVGGMFSDQNRYEKQMGAFIASEIVHCGVPPLGFAFRSPDVCTNCFAMQLITVSDNLRKRRLSGEF